jgi:transcription elongation factor GreA
MTAEGMAVLQAELAELEGPGRERIAAQIRTAREWGDLKENGEYHAAKEAQAHLETKIAQLRERMLTADVVEAAAGGVAGLGSVVEVEDEATGRRSTYTLVSSSQASPAEGKLSIESPVAAALEGLRAGDVAVAALPRGEKRLRIVSVS